MDLGQFERFRRMFHTVRFDGTLVRSESSVEGCMLEWDTKTPRRWSTDVW